MNRLFLPKRMRYKLTSKSKTVLLLLGTLFLIASLISASITIIQRRDIEHINLLSNRELLTAKIAAKKSPENRDIYKELHSEVSSSYREERKKHLSLFTLTLTLFFIGSAVLKVRKNLAG